MSGLRFHIQGYEVRDGRISYPDRYRVEWQVAGQQKTKQYTYLTRAETFAEAKRSAGFEVKLWDGLGLKYLTF